MANVVNPGRTHGLIAVALAALTVISMGHVVSNDFVNIDDPSYVTSNPKVQAGLTSSSIRWAWTTNHGGFWIPITWTSFLIDATLYWPTRAPSGTDLASVAAWGFHLTNLLLHVANTLLVYWLVFRLIGSIGGSALVAALFAIHPLRVESVAWITERKDLLSVFFGLLALLAYLRYQEKRGVGRMALVALLLALSLMAKPLLVTLPAVMILLDCWPLKRWGSPKWYSGLRPVILEKLPLLVLSAVFTVITISAQRGANAVFSLEQLPLSARVGNALLSYESYLFKTFWPMELAVFYPHPLLYPSLRDPTIWFAVARAALVLCVVTVLVVAMRKAVPGLLVGWLWFIGTLCPNIGLLQAGTQGSADRFTYFPLLGLFLGLVCCGIYFARRFEVRAGVQAAVGFVAVLVLAMLTWAQVALWENSRILYKHTLTITRNNAYVHTLLGTYFYQKRDLENAELHLAASNAIRERAPEYAFVEFHHTYGSVLLERGMRESDADALTKACYQLNRTIELDPNLVAAYFKLALAQLALGQADAASQTIHRALPLASDAVLQQKLQELLRECEKPRTKS